MATKPTDKNTKAEILTAYNQLVDEKKALEAQVKNARQAATPASIPTAKVVKDEPKAMTNAGSTQDKVNQTITNLDSLQLGFGSAVSEFRRRRRDDMHGNLGRGAGDNGLCTPLGPTTPPWLA